MAEQNAGSNVIPIADQYGDLFWELSVHTCQLIWGGGVGGGESSPAWRGDATHVGAEMCVAVSGPGRPPLHEPHANDLLSVRERCACGVSVFPWALECTAQCSLLLAGRVAKIGVRTEAGPPAGCKAHRPPMTQRTRAHESGLDVAVPDGAVI